MAATSPISLEFDEAMNAISYFVALRPLARQYTADGVLVWEEQLFDPVLERQLQCDIENTEKNVAPFHRDKYEKEASKNWNHFYKRNEANFYKDRHYLGLEFDDLNSDEEKRVLEVGCGVGNAIFPLLEQNPNLFVYACDFSEHAVSLVQANPSYRESRVICRVSDITCDPLSRFVPPSSIDICTMLYVLSAIPPQSMCAAVQNVVQCLRPGGVLLFRDYGEHDLAQVRFARGGSTGRPHKLRDNFYVRQDGTCSYFFSEAYLKSLLESCGLVEVSLHSVRRKYRLRRSAPAVSKQKSKTTKVTVTDIASESEPTMNRVWVQAKFKKL